MGIYWLEQLELWAEQKKIENVLNKIYSSMYKLICGK